MYLKQTFFAALFFCSTVASAQEQIIISGKVIDADSKRPVSSVSIINPKAGVTNVSLSDGTFRINARKADTLFLFLPGYQTVRFSVADSASKPEYSITLYMQMFVTEAKAVIIKPKKTLSQIEEERKKLGQTPRELDLPKIEPFTSPISAIYDMLSDETRQKKKLRGQMIEDNRRRLLYALFDYYREQDVIDIPQEYYDSFINYCPDLDIDFLKYTSDYEITRTIVDRYKRYSRFSGIVK
jgi:hypothetical protein